MKLIGLPSLSVQFRHAIDLGLVVILANNLSEAAVFTHTENVEVKQTGQRAVLTEQIRFHVSKNAKKVPSVLILNCLWYLRNVW